MIVLIGCGKKKNDKKCKAQDMYLGNYFQTCLRYAKTFGGDIYILSAKHGLLELDKYIEPYDKTLNKMTKKEKLDWKNMVLTQLQRKNLMQEKVVFLCGKNYYEQILDNFKEVLLPLQKFSGMGYQLQYMNSLLSNKQTFSKNSFTKSLF